jgi:hypothetical protein
VVDRSLETLAADRGITICFADLDGVDGLWLPDERTIMVSRRLGDRRAAEVLDHELTHVDIEDGHAALDAAVRRRSGRTRIAAASAAAASLVLLFGIRLQFAGDPTGDPHQAPAPQAGLTTAPPQTGQQLPPGGPSVEPTTTVVTQVFDAGVRTRTVTVTPTTPPSPPARSAAATVRPAAPTVPAGPMNTPTPTATAPPATSSAPPSPTDTPTPTASPTLPAGTSAVLP